MAVSTPQMALSLRSTNFGELLHTIALADDRWMQPHQLSVLVHHDYHIPFAYTVHALERGPRSAQVQGVLTCAESGCRVTYVRVK